MATYLINQLPNSVLHWKSPYEVLFTRPPDYTTLRCFGCLCFATATTPHLDKFDPRASRCIFLGFQPGMKAYKLYNLLTKSVLFSQDVVFHKSIFPFSSQPAPASVSPLPLSSLESSFQSISPTLDTVPSPSVFAPLSPSPSPPASSLRPPRRGTRFCNSPAWLTDYVTHCSITSSLITSIVSPTETTSYHQACLSPAWVDAMHNELATLEANHTWDLTSPPVGKRPIGCRWADKLKHNLDGSIDRYKARLVAKGYN